VVLVNGEPSDGRIPVTDSAVLRGDGCFEVIRAYRGTPFMLDAHLERLERSGSLLEVEVPPFRRLRGWVEQVASELGDCAIRVVLTRGGSLPGETDPPLAIVFAHQLDASQATASLASTPAPWHAAGYPWELSGAKLLSYAPNMAASRSAHARGYDDALLTTTGGVVLEGPTFALAWVVDGTLETPTLDLGILDSITRRIALELAAEASIPVVEGIFELARLGLATEVMVMSTLREIQPVALVDEQRFDAGPVTEALQAELRSLTDSL
jgi:branched-subunit amino acid aminotransferase/4-amino-4-deoxychorismate lyase